MKVKLLQGPEVMAALKSSADQELAMWIMCERAALYGVTLAAIVVVVCAAADRWLNR